MLKFLIDHQDELITLAVALLPTLIVGLTKYPRVNGFLALALEVLQRVSVVHHKDSPGTFKLPLTGSPPPEDHL